MRLVVKPVTIDEFKEIEAQFRTSVVNPGALQEAWQSLHDFFGNRTDVDIEYQWTFFRLYTQITWNLLATLEPKVVIDVAIRRQALLALYQGVDVWTKIMWYLVMVGADKSDREVMYKQMQEAFFSSSEIFMVAGRRVTVANLVESVKKINQSTISSLESAEIMGNIKNSLSIKTDDAAGVVLLSDADVVYDHFVGLVNFFLGVTPENLYLVIDSFLHPEVDFETSVEDEVATAVPADAVNHSDSNYTDIKSMIEARFTRDASGEFTNLDGVLALLDSLATDQGDDQIRELYYFDEGAGKFQWNEALLT